MRYVYRFCYYFIWKENAMIESFTDYFFYALFFYLIKIIFCQSYLSLYAVTFVTCLRIWHNF